MTVRPQCSSSSSLPKIAKFKGKDIIRIHVGASSTPPVRLDGTIWVRPGPTTRRATREDERVLTEKRRSIDLPFDVRPQEAALTEDLDLNLFQSTILPAFVSPETVAENGRSVEQQLSSLKISSPTGLPTVMGLLLIGINPTEFIPGGYLQFVRYNGNGVESPVADAQELRSNVINIADRLQNVLRGHLHTSLASAGGFRDEDRPDYPLEALREVCMNAIIHRNYELSYAPVRIAWFNDRIEVTNPGGPFGQVNSENYDRVNDYRNPSLAGAMKDLGYVNRFGRGIGRVRSALQANGNPPPEFIVDDSSWTVTLRGSK